jgi:hypothetical protein
MTTPHQHQLKLRRRLLAAISIQAAAPTAGMTPIPKPEA